jgi:hypothetical protein
MAENNYTPIAETKNNNHNISEEGNASHTHTGKHTLFTNAFFNAVGVDQYIEREKERTHTREKTTFSQA